MKRGAMAKKVEGKTNNCPHCGEEVESDLSTCPTCGGRIRSRKSAGKMKSKEEDGIFFCPNCGSFLSKNAKRCYVCHMAVEDGELKPSDDEKEAPAETDAKSSLFMCPECGAFLSEKAVRCPICKVEIVDDEIGESEDVALVETELKACDVCGTDIPTDSVKCEICGASVGESDDVAVAEELSEGPKCPVCDSVLAAGETKCNSCGTELLEEGDERVEKDIDKFFEQLKSGEEIEFEPEDEAPEISIEPESIPFRPQTVKKTPAPRPVVTSAEPGASTPIQSAGIVDKRIPLKVKKPVRLPAKPSVKLRSIGLKSDRKFEFLFIAAIMSLIIHYAGIQSGLQNIWYAAVILYGFLFVISVLFAFKLDITRKLPRGFLIQIFGLVLSASVPLRWLLSAPNPIDVPILGVGVSLVVIGLLMLKEWKISLDSIHFILMYGLLMILSVSIFNIAQPGNGSGFAVAVGVIGAAFMIFAFVLLLYKKLVVPLTLPVDEMLSDIDASSKDSVPRRAYNNDLPWYSKASALMLLERYKEALECAETAIRINPKSEVGWLIKGNALTKLSENLEALKCFNRAIKINPMYEVAWNNKGNALSRLKKYEKALSCYDEAIKLVPDYREAWVNKGYVLAKLGKYKDAASCAEKVMSIVPRAKAEA
jgi:RNA polymerase subunit RPABC4/transcription elongation factor Spt4